MAVGLYGTFQIPCIACSLRANHISLIETLLLLPCRNFQVRVHDHWRWGLGPPQFRRHVVLLPIYRGNHLATSRAARGNVSFEKLQQFLLRNRFHHLRHSISHLEVVVRQVDGVPMAVGFVVQTLVFLQLERNERFLVLLPILLRHVNDALNKRRQEVVDALEDVLDTVGGALHQHAEPKDAHGVAHAARHGVAQLLLGSKHVIARLQNDLFQKIHHGAPLDSLRKELEVGLHHGVVFVRVLDALHHSHLRRARVRPAQLHAPLQWPFTHRESLGSTQQRRARECGHLPSVHPSHVPMHQHLDVQLGHQAGQEVLNILRGALLEHVDLLLGGEQVTSQRALAQVRAVSRGLHVAVLVPPQQLLAQRLEAVLLHTMVGHLGADALQQQRQLVAEAV
mmetsp:Transcript_40275/g.77007  ORF Transcript_40275/g.77007 Transcript_40275/m.77007 type:complete len:395 (-) Transcript_40275:288-1472(-)